MPLNSPGSPVSCGIEPRTATGSRCTDTLNDWFNSAYVRANFPAVVVCPYADQSTDPTGLAQNWLDPANLAGTRAVVDQAIRDFSIDERRIYVTGDGMGGDAAWSLAL